MNRQELKAIIESKDQVLGIVQEKESQSPPDATRYLATLKIQTSEGGINYKNIAYYVTSEGQPEEQAYWEGANPFPDTTVVSNFRADVYNKINQVIQGGTIKGAIVDKLDTESKTAQVTAYKQDPQDVNKVVVLYYMVKDVDGTLAISEISSSL